MPVQRRPPATPLQLVTSRKYQADGLAVDAPVLAQAYAALGRAYDGFEACRNVVETPFPFPWSQVRTMRGPPLGPCTGPSTGMQCTLSS